MIKQNIIWNFLGGTLPLLVGVVVFPLIIQQYGIERFGILAIAWSLVGYFGLFDMGLSRALTQTVSNKLSQNTKPDEVVTIIHSALTVTWGLGIFGGVILWMISEWLVLDILSVSKSIEYETIQALKTLAIAIPFVVLTSMLRGVMESLHLFKSANFIRMFLGVCTFLGPYLIAFYGISLVYAVYTLLAIRIIAWLMHAYAVHSTELMRKKIKIFKYNELKPLFTFGGWMTVSNVIGPLMVYFDRFLIAYLLGASAVAYYVAPYEMITKLWIIPGSIAGVLFPIFSKERHTNSTGSVDVLIKGMLYVSIILFPIIFLFASFASEGMHLWLGADFATNSTAIVGWFSAGILVNSIGQILYAKIQGLGRPDLTAKLHIFESIPYWLVLYILIKSYGIEGAAMAWFLRVSVDSLLLAISVTRLCHQSKQQIFRLLCFLPILLLPVISANYITSLYWRALLFFITILIFSFFAIKKMHEDGTFLYFKKILTQNDK